MTMHDCPHCGTTNNKTVNDEHCWNCGHEWKPIARVVRGP